MITDQATASQSKPGSGREAATKIERRTMIGAGLAALLTAACSSPTESAARRLSPSGLVTAEDRDEGTDEGSAPNDPFILLLKGFYQPVPMGSGKHNFGLTTVDLDDGSYSKTRIYPIFGIRGSTHQDKSIGAFYVSLVTRLCAYDLPGGRSEERRV